MTAFVIAALMLAPATLSAAPAAPATDPAVNVKRIKDYKFAVRAVEYKGKTEVDPFGPGIPMKTVVDRKDWKVRISTLKMSSVIVGKQKVAIFTEMIGPAYSYILRNGILVGPDHKPIPGIKGTLEETKRRGEFRVILQQGGETVVHTMRIGDTIRRKTMEMQEVPNDRRPKGGGG